MNPIARRIVRWFHLIISIPIIGYIYSSFEAIPSYAPLTRFVFLPAMLVSGLWMWKGHWVLTFLAKRPAPATR